MSDDATRADIDTLLAPLAHGLLGLAIALSIFQGGAAQDESAPSLVLARDGFLVAALFLTCVRAGMRGRLEAPPASIAIPLLALVGAAWLSVGVAEDRYAALRAAWRWSAMGILAWLAIPLGQRLRGARSILALVLACSGVVLALAWKERLIDLPASRAVYLAHPEIAEVDPTMREEFQSRLFTNQVSGPFLLPNGLGALAAMAMMGAAGLALARSGAASRLLGGALLAVATGAGIFSNQKAPWLAMAGAAAIVAAALTGSRRARAGIVGGLALAAIAGAAVVAIVPGARWERAPGGLSIAVRREYAATAARMIASSPLRGIGAGNYGAREAELKEARDEEARFAHDDYLEAAAEMGLLGGLALVVLWLVLIARGATSIAHRPRGAQAADGASPGDPGLALICGGSLGVSLVAIFGARYASIEIAGPSAVAVAAIGLALRASIRAPSGALAAGALGGAAAFALQATVDFLHPERGLTSAAIALAAAVAGLCGSTGNPREIALPGPLRALPAGAALALFVLLGSVALPRVAASDAAKEAARQAIGRGDATAAIAAEEEAIAAVPVDAEARALLADTLAELFRRASPGDRPRLRDEAIAAYEAACAGRSGLADVKARAAALLALPPAEPARALAWLERAALAYPSSPHHRLDLARALVAAGERDRARAEVARALAMDGDVRTWRLRLGDAERAEAARMLREP